MGHESKAGIGYHLPQQCCGKCDHSYRNTYDDACCYLLESYELIDFGGICDRYICQTEAVQPAPVEQLFEIKADELVDICTCEYCKFSYLKDNVPMCSIDDSVIQNTKGRCGAWERDDDTE